jgi:polyisoprenoid-binding protein YceI
MPPRVRRFVRIAGPALLTATLLLCSRQATGTDAAPAMVELDSAATRVAFTLRGALHTVEGGFALKHGTITLDPATGKAEGLIVIDAASGRSGNNSRDAAMRNDVLESSRYPEIRFTPQRFERLDSAADEIHLAVHGLLALHGTEHEITLPVVARLLGDQVTFTTHFLVPYVAWGLKDPSLLIFRVAKEVAIEASGVGHLAPLTRSGLARQGASAGDGIATDGSDPRGSLLAEEAKS